MAYEYAQLSMGVNDKKSVSQLQALLNEKIGAGLETDGIFGPKTSQAVKNYQQKNSLAVDGIVGPKTWASLLSAGSEKAAAPGSSGATATNRTEALKDAAAAAKEAYEALRRKENEKFAFEGQQMLDAAARDYLDRPAFSYDLYADPLYQQYASQYTGLGRQAMEDTMGRAAALTGGYGNSYAQTAGQQTYGSYLQQLNDRVPELYELALSKYQKDGEQLRSRYELLKAMENQAYSRHQDALERSDALRKEDYEKEQDRKKEQQAAFDQMLEMIREGYIPTDQEMAAFGLTYRQVIALASGGKG